jgi:hypothetical protein
VTLLCAWAHPAQQAAATAIVAAQRFVAIPFILSPSFVILIKQLKDIPAASIPHRFP